MKKINYLCILHITAEVSSCSNRFADRRSTAELTVGISRGSQAEAACRRAPSFAENTKPRDEIVLELTE